MKRTYTPAIRDHARALRREGYTYREIITELGGDIPKNTISTWVSDISLTAAQQARIKQIERVAQQAGHLLGADWNREQKRQRIAAAEAWAEEIVPSILNNPDALLAFMAALWLGEGSKKDHVFEFANSDPKIVRGWLTLLRSLFEVNEEKLRGQLLLNHRMDESECLRFWVGITKIPITQFNKSQIDERDGKKQKAGYYGVIRITYNFADLRRKIGALGFAILRELSE